MKRLLFFVLTHILLIKAANTQVELNWVKKFGGDSFETGYSVAADNLGFIYKNQDVYVINPVLRNSKKLDINEKFLKQRYGLVSKALSCNNFGILVSLKKGQFRLKYANYLKQKQEV